MDLLPKLPVRVFLGTCLLKYSHLRRAKGARASIYRSKWWLFGFSVFVVGNLINFVSFSFAAQSLLAGTCVCQGFVNKFLLSFLQIFLLKIKQVPSMKPRFPHPNLIFQIFIMDFPHVEYQI